ncbi:MAG: GNAT family N-acetyltransferase [Deltaproteobacteria bacterium]|nr:GNAT family N-acetyltransferase [Deltaproteobacteria bacterium]
MALLGFRRSRRQSPAWQEVDEAVYREAYGLYGGSVITHPRVVATISAMVAMAPRYLALYRDGRLLGALALWGDYLAGDKRCLKKIGRRRVYDLGNAEVVLPLSRAERFSLRGFRGQFLSGLHRENIDGLVPQGETLSLARSFSRGDFSGKFRYTRRRELKRFREAGGEVVPLDSLEPAAVAAVYRELFRRRWERPPKGDQRLEEFLRALWPLLTGFLLTMAGQPVAIQLLYQVTTVVGVAVEYVNGGVDPHFSRYSPGTILSFLNLQAAEELADRERLPLRFSFGLTDQEYKNRWAVPQPVYRL